MPVLQRPRQLRGCTNRTQDGRNYGTFPLHELAEKRLNLLVLPGANATISDENRCRLYAVDLLSKRRLPGSPGLNLLFIQPRFDAFADQPPTDLADGWLVLAVVAHEHIKDFRFGIMCVHKEAIL